MKLFTSEEGLIVPVARSVKVEDLPVAATSVTATRQTNNDVTVAWSHGGGATSFALYVATDGDNAVPLISGIDGAARTYNDLSLHVADASVQYLVVARNAFGPSPAATSNSVVPNPAVSGPPAGFALIHAADYPTVGADGTQEWTAANAFGSSLVVDPSAEGIAAPPEGGNALRVTAAAANPYTQFFSTSQRPLSYAVRGGERVRQQAYLRVSSTANRRYLTMRTRYTAELEADLAFGTSCIFPRDGRQDFTVTGHFHETASFTVETAGGLFGAYNQWPNMLFNGCGQNGTELDGQGQPAYPAVYTGNRQIVANQWMPVIHEVEVNTFSGGVANTDGVYRLWIGEPGATYADALANPRATQVWPGLIIIDRPQGGFVVFQAYQFGATGTIYRARERAYRSTDAQIDYFPARSALPSATLNGANVDLAVVAIKSLNATDVRWERSINGGAFATLATVAATGTAATTDTGPFTQDASVVYRCINEDSVSGTESEPSILTPAIVPNPGAGGFPTPDIMDRFSFESDWGIWQNGGGDPPTGENGQTFERATGAPAGLVNQGTWAARLVWTPSAGDGGGNATVQMASSTQEIWIAMPQYHTNTNDSILKNIRFFDTGGALVGSLYNSGSNFSWDFGIGSTPTTVPGFVLNEWMVIEIHYRMVGGQRRATFWINGTQQTLPDGAAGGDEGAFWDNGDLVVTAGPVNILGLFYLNTLNGGVSTSGTIWTDRTSLSTVGRVGPNT